MNTAVQNTNDSAEENAANTALAADGSQKPTDDESVSITLKKPITRGKTKITAVVVRKPGVLALGGVVLADLVRMHTDEVVRVLPRTTEPPLVPSLAAVRYGDTSSIKRVSVELSEPSYRRNERWGSIG